MPPSRTTVDDWNEYKRLVLAELERLGHDVEKLHAQMADNKRVSDQQLEMLRVDIYQRIADLDKETSQLFSLAPNQQQMADIRYEMSKVEQRLTYKKENSTDNLAARWEFWAAIATVVGGIVATVISSQF